MTASFPTPFPKSGFRLIDSGQLNKQLNFPQNLSYEDKIIATPSGNQATAYQLEATISRLGTVTNNADSVALPSAVAGRWVVVINDGAANAQVFGKGTDTIDAVATATGVVLSAAKRSWFFCVANGAWESLAGSKTT